MRYSSKLVDKQRWIDKKYEVVNVTLKEILHKITQAREKDISSWCNEGCNIRNPRK
jgi:hypothetical protein